MEKCGHSKKSKQTNEENEENTQTRIRGELVQGLVTILRQLSARNLAINRLEVVDSASLHQEICYTKLQSIYKTGKRLIPGPKRTSVETP